MLFINCKVQLSFLWNANCVLTPNPNNNNNVDSATFKVKDAELYIPACYSINKKLCKTNKTIE